MRPPTPHAFTQAIFVSSLRLLALERRRTVPLFAFRFSEKDIGMTCNSFQQQHIQHQR